MNQIKEFSDFLSQFDGTLHSNRTLLVFFSCFVIGQIVKMTKFIPNNYIPILVVSWGAWLTFLLDDHHTEDLSLFEEKVASSAVGMTIGFGAWFVHRYFIKVLIARLSKIPAIASIIDDNGSEQSSDTKPK